MNNIVFLYSEVVGYLIPIFKSLVKDYNCNVTVIHWDKNKLKPYKLPSLDSVNFIKRSAHNFSSLNQLIKDIDPKLVYVSGWMDKDYLKCTEILVKKNIPVVAGFDDVWLGSWRQKLGSMIFPYKYKKCFSHAWVAGPYQFEFAKRLGFKNREIIFDLLTANTSKFVPSNTVRENAFLYVGNFRNVKGTDILAEAFKYYRDSLNGDWKLTCIGNGELQSKLDDIEGIRVLPFSNEDVLVQIAIKHKVFILPSRHDQWGVVVHEFAAMGLALLLSNNVGAKASFLINGYNGTTFESDDYIDLARKMKKFSEYSNAYLSQMSKNSCKLSNKISIESCVANLMSVT